MFIAIPKKALEEKNVCSQQTVFIAQSKAQLRRVITQAGYDFVDFVKAAVLEQ